MKSTLKLIKQGIANMQQAHQEGEGAKLGNLRAGSSGVLAFGTKIAGTCMRIAYLRSKGIDGNPATEDREHMFAGGRHSENVIEEYLNAAAEPGLTWLREEQYPMTWFTTNGTKVTGRPDFVLGRKQKVLVDHTQSWGEVIQIEADDFIPERILELKLVSAAKTARDVGILMKPKLMHVLQAAHYSLKLGVPAELWYRNQASFDVTFKSAEGIPKDHPRVQYTWKGEPHSIKPFMQSYLIGFTEQGQVYYQAVDYETGELAPPVQTIVTKDGIVGYFEQLSRMDETQELPTKPADLELDGQKQSWAACNYCPLKAVCQTSKVSTVNEWVDKVKKFKGEVK